MVHPMRQELGSRKMTVSIFDMPQGSPDWFAARMGIPTASEFGTVLAKGKDGGASVTRKTYMRKLAGEIITGVPTESYSNEHMDRGKVMEAEARETYAFVHNVNPQAVGFVRNGDKGCSPDSFLGFDGILEIKTALPHILIDHILIGNFPAAHVAQCQGALWVCEREWIDICVYWPGMPLYVKRAHRDDAYIAKLASAVDEFNDELAQMVERVRDYDRPRVPLKAAFEQSIIAAG